MLYSRLYSYNNHLNKSFLDQIRQIYGNFRKKNKQEFDKQYMYTLRLGTN